MMNVKLIDSMGTDLTVVNAALADNVQEETKEIATQIADLVQEKFPICFKYLYA